MASIASSTAATILLYPIERIKIEMQLDRQDGSFRSSYDRILRKYGLSGFYQGASSLVLGNTFAYGIYFVVYERLKAHFKLGNEHSLLKIPLCSGIAGCIGSIATNPFYVIQTRQTNTNKSFFAVANEIAAKEGLSSLEKGLLASLILVTNPIIQFLVYEWLKNKLKKNGT